ncbi:MAG TPA: malto-oligosyltrehalose trehalohydrolase [Pedobacter sp.]|nr:malto-oligosyltrehalose trehalohydrolase [Pedobacter sp.]
MDVHRKNIGMNCYLNNWQLRVWAPDAMQLQLKLETSDREFDLNPKEHGYWELNAPTISDGDRYWLVVDGKQLPDPATVSQPDGVHGPSQAIAMDFPDEPGWKNIPLRDYIFYELHTGTFSEGGDFEGIAEKLDYLLELGITAIEIMPVASFPGERNWGYDGVFPFAVQASYGGAIGLQELVCLCHRKGLAVVLDVVYNHLGPEGNYLSDFGPYFTDKYQTPWGNAVNFDDRNANGVREYFIENALMWFRDFHVDALRLDAVHAIKDFSAIHILQEIRKYTDLLTRHTGRNYYLIAECDLNDPRYITSPDFNGLGMHGQWVDEFHHALRVSAGEPKQGYYSDFNGIAHLGKSYRDAYVYTGMYSQERRNYFGRSAKGHAGSQFVVFSQNHDQVGNRMLGERSSVLVSFEMQKLMAAAVIFSPFLPMLFMGEEWGETNPFLYFVDHTDSKLIEMVRKGRKEEFAAMQTSGLTPDPKDEHTFHSSKLNWSLSGKQKHASLLTFYKKLIALRKEHPALKSDDLDSVRPHICQEQNCLLIERGAAESKELLLFAMNFSNLVQCIPLPSNIVIDEKIIDSSDAQWLSPESFEEASVQPTGDLSNIIVQPESFLAYSAFYA